MRRLALPFALAALVGLLAAACSAGSDGDSAADGGDDDTATATTATGEPATSTSQGRAEEAADTGAEDPPADDELTYAGERAAPDFPADLTWFNADRPLSLAQDLRGKVVLLDFWTQGCINCLHVIPDLVRLEEEFGDAFVVVGVHWAKFDRERTDQAIAAAVRRNGVPHPVVNDAQSEIARSYGAQAWPTQILIDPDGNIVGGHAGEGTYDVFHDPISVMVEEFGAAGRLDTRPLDDVLAEPAPSPAVLSFPGAVLADEEGERLFIADTGRDRILEATLDGRLVRAIGDGQPGLVNGPADTARFRSPAGMSLSGDGSTLYVADRENHAVRSVDLATGEVSIVAGTGEQGAQVTTDGLAVATAVPSPWDVLVVADDLYIAGAGRHQLYRVDLTDGMLYRFAGTGAEGIDDGPPLRGTLSQPSGLTTDGTWLWFTDPEASAVRRLPLEGGEGGLETLIGTGLFDWGDSVGTFDETQLQHATGIEVVGEFVVVADTYNNRLKVLDPAAETTVEWAGGGQSGFADGVGTAAQFAEPNLISATSTHLYVADTNNHQIRMVDVSTVDVTTLELTNLDVAAVASVGLSSDTVRVGPQQVGPGPVTIEVGYELPDGYKLNDEGTFTMSWAAGDGDVITPSGTASVSAKAPDLPIVFEAEAAAGDTVVTAESTVYYCLDDNEGFCLVRDVTFEIPVEVRDGGASVATATHALPDATELGIPVPD